MDESHAEAFESDPEESERYPSDVVDGEFDFSKGTNRVWFGLLCSARIGEDALCHMELHDINGETHQIVVPQYRVDQVQRLVGNHVRASCWETADEQGARTVKLYFIARTQPFSGPGPHQKREQLEKRWAAEGRRSMTGAEFAEWVRELLPTPEAAVRFGRELEQLRGRKLYDD